jgi:hypothetical protein
MNKAPLYFIQNDSQLKVVWKYVSHGPNFVWLERLGDGLVSKPKSDEFFEGYLAIRSNLLSQVLNNIDSDRSHENKSYIYDIYVEPEESGVWFKLYKTCIHKLPVIRECLELGQV